jgi:very-short-patch-repair endonuclease
MTTEQRSFARTLRKHPTSAEDTLWQALRGRKLAGLKFKRQVPLLSYTVDFFCFDRKLVVELDGRQHGWHAEYDDCRTAELEAFGLQVIRFRNAEVMGDLDAVLDRITQAASSGTGHPHPRPLSHPGEG